LRGDKLSNKLLGFILIVLIAALFTSYFIIKESIFPKGSLESSLNQIENYSKNEEWDKAAEISKEIKNKWKRYKPLIMLNYAEEDFSTFENLLSDIIGGTEAEDLPTVLTSVKSAKDLWENINRLVPEP